MGLELCLRMRESGMAESEKGCNGSGVVQVDMDAQQKCVTNLAATVVSG